MANQSINKIPRKRGVYHASTHQLTRILTFLEMVDIPVNQTMIVKGTEITNSIKDGLNSLNSLNKCEVKKDV